MEKSSTLKMILEWAEVGNASLRKKVLKLNEPISRISKIFEND